MKTKTLLAWIVVGLAAAIFVVWAYPRVDPFAADAWEVSRDEARAIALELSQELGDLPDDPFVIVSRATDEGLMFRLSEYVDDGGTVQAVRDSRLFPGLNYWSVRIYDPEETANTYAFSVAVTADGQFRQVLRLMKADEAADDLEPGTVRGRSDELLTRQGFDLSHYAEPEIRTRDRDNRTDTTLRYVDSESLLGEQFTYGLDVRFSGDQLMGFTEFFDDPEEDSLIQQVQSVGLWQFAWIYLAMLLVPLVAIPFMRRYHAGEVGVRRGLHIAAVMLGAGFLCILFTAQGIAGSWSFGILSKPLTAVAIGFIFTVTFYMPMAVLGLLGWTVGESICRKHWGLKLAGFDALFRGQWRNATFARASLRGLVSGLAIVAIAFGFIIAMPRGVFALEIIEGAPSWASTQWWGVPVVCFALIYSLYNALFGQLFLVPWLANVFGRVGRWVGPIVATLVAATIFFPMALLLPAGWTFALSVLVYGLSVLVFLRWGVFASFVALFATHALPVAIPLLGSAHDPSIQLNAALVVLIAALPMLLSFRYLFSEDEFVYRYEDIPPHVRRIADRERQKVELETARGIQSSILPELPPELNGVQLSHRYLPASEVGGDFYDVLALEDGRLAVAVGDVAGHGVSSGLVMSMAKSALSVQVTFNPEVEPVFNTLNRMVFQSARKRLLTTLCYALVDPVKKEMFFASAGHLFPYRVSSGGEVVALESVSYPLGVRDQIEITARVANLESGDKLFLYSDGVVEASPEGSAEQFGFDRLEQSLKRHATRDVHGMRDGVLADMQGFAGNQPLDDDLTVLVLQLP